MTLPAALIADYRAAYLQANGCEFSYSLTYESGWFVFRQPYTVRRRRKEVEGMIARLKYRASPPPSTLASTGKE